MSTFFEFTAHFLEARIIIAFRLRNLPGSRDSWCRTFHPDILLKQIVCCHNGMPGTFGAAGERNAYRDMSSAALTVTDGDQDSL
ncbi:MAG: hypothetical protein ACR2Q3_02425, partial [Woeseiaceae bacterium]